MTTEFYPRRPVGPPDWGDDPPNPTDEELDAEYEEWVAWEDGAYGPEDPVDPLPRFEIVQGITAFRQGDTHVQQESHRKPRLIEGAGDRPPPGWKRLLVRLVPFRRRSPRGPLRHHNAEGDS